MSNTTATGQATENTETPETREGAQPSTTAKVAERAHEAINRVSDRVEKSEQALRNQVDNADAQLREAADGALKSANTSLEEVRGYIRANPLTSAAIAFGAGYLLSALTRK